MYGFLLLLYVTDLSRNTIGTSASSFTYDLTSTYTQADPPKTLDCQIAHLFPQSWVNGPSRLEDKCSLGIAFQVTALATPLITTFSFPCATNYLLLVFMVTTLTLCSVGNVLPLFSNLENLSHTAKSCTIVFSSMKHSLEHFPECTTPSVLLQVISWAYAQHLFLLSHLVISFPF